MSLLYSEKVLLTVGQRPISTVAQGQTAYVYNPNLAQARETKVLRLETKGTQPIFSVETGNRRVSATQYHVFLVRNASGSFYYKRLMSLEPGRDQLVVPVVPGGAPIGYGVAYETVTRCHSDGSGMVYTIQVESNLHNFIHGVVSACDDFPVSQIMVRA